MMQLSEVFNITPSLIRNFVLYQSKMNYLLWESYKSLSEIHWLPINENEKKVKLEDYLVNKLSLCNTH